MQLVLIFFTGFLFAVGLGISGMTQPAKIVNFLDLTGNWDPSLIFVMIGAIAVHFIAFRLITKRKSPIFSKSFMIPNRKDITPSLIIGAAIFGIGWSMGGYCPGPALTSLATGDSLVIIFVVSVIAGMFIFKVFDKMLLSK
jgi:hypothetical protein